MANVLSPQIANAKVMRNWLIDKLASYLPEGYIPNPPTFGQDVPFEPSTWQEAGQKTLNFLVPQPEDTLIAPAELRPNFRSPEQIRALRHIMAEEQRARGPLNDFGGGTYREWQTNPVTKEAYLADVPISQPDPIDQILRGLSPKAQKGYISIQPVMDENASRLGDIYKERSWWNRLSEDVKTILLQDNPHNETIVKKLKGEL